MQQFLTRRSHIRGRLAIQRRGEKRTRVALALAFSVLFLGARVHAQSDGSEASAWKVLDSAWASGQSDLRGYVLGSLARVHSLRATEVFRKALIGSSDLAARAANLLSEQRASDLLPEISDRLKTEHDLHTQIELVSCLRRVHSPAAAAIAIPFAMTEHEPLTGVAFGALQDMGPVAVPALTRVLKEGCFKCRESAAYVLLSGAPENEAFKPALRDSNSHVQILAALALAKTGSAVGADILRTAAAGSEFPFRIWAELALYNSGRPQYQQALLNDLESARDSDRYFAVRETLRSGNPPLRNIVEIMAQNDASPLVRSAVLETLQDTSAGALLLEGALRDQDPGIRSFAAKKALVRRTAGPELESVVRVAFRTGSLVDQQEILTALASGGGVSAVCRGTWRRLGSGPNLRPFRLLRCARWRPGDLKHCRVLKRC